VPHALYGIIHLAALCRLLPSAIRIGKSMMRWSRCSTVCSMRAAPAPTSCAFELQLLAELGFGLDLATCAASGSEADLVYVSPKSGRAVSRQAGEPWKGRLLALRHFSTARRRTIRRHRISPTPTR